MLYSSTGNSFHRLGSQGRGASGRDYSDAPLATSPFLHVPLFLFSLLSLLSTKVCLIHKGLIANTAAAPSSLSGFSTGFPFPRLILCSKERGHSNGPQTLPCFLQIIFSIFEAFPIQMIPPSSYLVDVVCSKESSYHPCLKCFTRIERVCSTQLPIKKKIWRNFNI